MKASIVIGSHNEGDLLWKTVQSCVEGIDGLEHEIVVVDDASDDGSVDELTRRFPEVRVIRSPVRQGASPSKDLAARSSRGEVLVFLDAHCKAEPGAIERMVRDVEDWKGQAIIAPRIELLDPESWTIRLSRTCSGHWLDLEWFRNGWVDAKDMTEHLGADGRVFYEQPNLAGCSLAITRELYETLQGFDPGMRYWGREDCDLGLKCWLLGYKLLVDPELIIGHRFRTEGTYYVPLEQVLENQFRMARKNFGDPAWEDWITRARKWRTPEFWDLAWSGFERNRESVERERDYLMSTRVRDEYQYAAEFGLAWPLVLDSSPIPAPANPRRLRFSSPDEDTEGTTITTRKEGTPKPPKPTITTQKEPDEPEQPVPPVTITRPKDSGAPEPVPPVTITTRKDTDEPAQPAAPVTITTRKEPDEPPRQVPPVTITTRKEPDEPAQPAAPVTITRPKEPEGAHKPEDGDQRPPGQADSRHAGLAVSVH